MPLSTSDQAINWQKFVYSIETQIQKPKESRSHVILLVMGTTTKCLIYFELRRTPLKNVNDLNIGTYAVRRFKGFILAVNIQHLVIWTHLGGEESWEFRASEMFGYLFSSYLYPPCALLFIAIPVQRWHDLWNLQGNVQRLRSHRGLRVLQIKHPNLSHYLALFTLEVQRCLKIRKMAPISDVWPIFWKQHSVKINLL